MSAIIVSSVFIMLFHLGVLGGDVYYLYDTFVNLPLGVKMLNALTVWNLILHTLYFLMATVIDFINLLTCTPGPYYRIVLSKVGLFWGRSSKAVHTLPGRSMWEQHRDRCFAIAFAVSNLVGILFWSLLFPGMKGKILVWDIWTHAATWASIWVELLLVLHVYRWKRLDIPLILVFCGSYLTTNIVYWHTTGKWWYPFQERLGLWAIAVYPGMILIAIIFYFIGRIISYYYWSWLGFACCRKCVDPDSSYDPVIAASSSDVSDTERLLP
eukprot:TRINITY_DN15464_c0_g1_i1.p1 TRINITY_DN15464_c0_g1~~TRINITY_DN15464_c0_g1_i1.p1  ORF type:complete len:269 (+),score=10.76 TRINITY_DN15464_c0_g1_i1:132-938(+)